LIESFSKIKVNKSNVGGDMPRVARIYTEEGVFHVLTRGNNRQVVFHDEEDFKVYKEKLKK